MRQIFLRKKFKLICLLAALLIIAFVADNTIFTKSTGTLAGTGRNDVSASFLETRFAQERAEIAVRQNLFLFTGNALKKDSEGGKKPVIKTVKVMATGYTAGYESTGKRPNHPQYGITYSGVKVRRDKNRVSTIAADLKIFPLGTILYIPGYGYGVVADKGSAIKGRKIDLYFDTTKQVFKEWGKKEVEVRVIRKGNGKLTEAMLLELGKAMEVSKRIPDDLWEKAI